MRDVTELDLPEIDYNSPDFGPATYHELLAAARERGWLAHSPLAYVVLDAESGDFFLRARQTAFPGPQIAGLFGITQGPLYEHIDANILNLTGDKHRRLRSLVGHAFTPRAADRWRPVMRGFLRRIWEELDGATTAEFVAAIAKPYPSRTIAAVPFTARIVLDDIEHRDVRFPAGTIVAVCAERANREQGGETFDITAERDPKLFTFGAGAHFCLGANLARAELEEALTFLAPRMPGLALASEPQLGGVEGIYGIESLPVRWD